MCGLRGGAAPGGPSWHHTAPRGLAALPPQSHVSFHAPVTQTQEVSPSSTRTAETPRRHKYTPTLPKSLRRSSVSEGAGQHGPLWWWPRSSLRWPGYRCSLPVRIFSRSPLNWGCFCLKEKRQLRGGDAHLTKDLRAQRRSEWATA